MAGSYKKHIRLPKGIDWELARWLEEFIHAETAVSAGVQWLAKAEGHGFEVRGDTVDQVTHDLSRNQVLISSVGSLTISGGTTDGFSIVVIQNNDSRSNTYFAAGSPGVIVVQGTPRTRVLGTAQLLREGLDRRGFNDPDARGKA